jgi:cyclopropane fatty-acyl-phospholipid synthase-like methyltransferase
MKHLLTKLRRRIRSLTQTNEERRHALVGPAELWKMKRAFQIRFLSDMGLKPGHYLFEIGCGTLRGGVPLIQYLENRHYFGVEVREVALDEGRKELREAGLEGKNPTLLLCPDISQLTVNRQFDYIWAFSVLLHMNDKILNATLAFVSTHLSEEGVFYANVNIGDRKEGNWQGFPVVARPFDFYSQACAMNGLVVSDLGPLKELGHIANIESQDNQRMLKIARRA